MVGVANGYVMTQRALGVALRHAVWGPRVGPFWPQWSFTQSALSLWQSVLSLSDGARLTRRKADGATGPTDCGLYRRIGSSGARYSHRATL